MDTASLNAIFIVGAAVVAVAMVIWITIFIRRAGRIARGTDTGLPMDLSLLAPPSPGAAPEVPASPTGSSIAWDSLPWSEPQVAAEPPLEPAAESTESKLAELNDLHARGLISDDELATARAKVLAG